MGCRWRLNASGELPGRASGYPPGPPTDPYVRNSRIRFLRQSCCYPSTVPWCAVIRVGELYVSPLSLTSGCAARRRLPSRGSLGPHFPTFLGTMRRYDCHLPVSGGFACRSPSRYLACFHRSWCPQRARDQEEAPGHARAFGHPVPQSGYETRRQLALPRSRVPPVETCPALRPRWCPGHSP